jgi:PilZ domain-containing protein
MPEMTIASGERKHPHVRRWRRYEVNVPIRVIIQRAMKATIIDGRGSALSEGGMAIFAGAELKAGEQVGVEFTPPYAALPIRVKARVCGRSGYHYGVEFISSDTEQEEGVAQFRRHLASIVG